MTSGGYSFSLTALLVGVPVLVGATCYYIYLNWNDSSEENRSSKQKDEKRELTPTEQALEYKRTGNHHYKGKNYDVAIRYYTKAIKLAEEHSTSINVSDLAIFYSNRAACYEALENYDLAVEDCTRAIENKKTYPKAYYRRAKALEKLKKYKEALVDAICVNLLEKFKDSANMSLTESLLGVWCASMAKEAMKTHKHGWPSNQTIKAYFSAFMNDPMLENRSKPFESAEELQPLFDEAMKETNDEDPLSLLVRGTCLSLMNDMKQAHEAFDKLLLMDTDDKIKSNALIKKSAIVLSDPTEGVSTGELEKVFELLNQALEVSPDNPDVHLHKAQALTLSEQLQEAQNSLDKALELKNDFHPARAQKYYIEFKVAMFGGQKPDKFLALFDNCILEYPDAPCYYQTYAQILSEINYVDEADQVLNKLSKIDPNDSGVLTSRALLQLSSSDDLEVTANLMYEAVRLDPRNVPAHEILGSIEVKRGEIDKAIEVFEAAVKFAQSEHDYFRCFSALFSTKCQKEAASLLGLSTESTLY